METRNELRRRLIGNLAPSSTWGAAPGNFDCPLCGREDSLHITVYQDRDDADPGYLWHVTNFCSCDPLNISTVMGMPCRDLRRSRSAS